MPNKSAKKTNPNVAAKRNKAAPRIEVFKETGADLTPEHLRHYARVVQVKWGDEKIGIDIHLGEADWEHSVIDLGIHTRWHGVADHALETCVPVLFLDKLILLLTLARNRAEKLGILDYRKDGGISGGIAPKARNGKGS